MADLANSYSTDDLAGVGFHLYEQFRPGILKGQEVWGAKGELEVVAIRRHIMHGKTQVRTLVVFISGLAKIADPWDRLINFYRSVSNIAVL